jgi:hypothetical protein
VFLRKKTCVLETAFSKVMEQEANSYIAETWSKHKHKSIFLRNPQNLKFGLWNGVAFCNMCHNLISNCTFNVIYATMNTEHHILHIIMDEATKFPSLV